MRLLAVARKEAIQFRRDRRSLALAFALPLVLLLIFGYAITWDVEDIRTAVLDHDGSARSRELGGLVPGVGTVPHRPVSRSRGRDRPLVERGAVRLVLVIPPDFAECLAGGGPAPVQAVIDGSDAEHRTIVLNYAEATVRTWALRAAKAGVPVRLPLVVGLARLVQRGAREPQHDRPRTDRGDHDDHRRHADVRHDRARVGARTMEQLVATRCRGSRSCSASFSPTS